MFKLLGADLLLVPILRQSAKFVKSLVAIFINFVEVTGVRIFEEMCDWIRKNDCLRNDLIF